MKSLETRVLTAHVPVPLAEKVYHFAIRMERSRNWIIKQTLSTGIAQQEERDLLTLEAVADVDAGRIMNRQSVQEWAEGLNTDQPSPLSVNGNEVTGKSASDLMRLYEFPAPVNQSTAIKAL